MIDLSAVSLAEREASLSAFARVFTLSISEGGAASVDDAVPAGMVFAPMLVLSTKRTLIESKQISPNQRVLDIENIDLTKRRQSVATFWAIRRLIGPSASPALNRSGDNPLRAISLSSAPVNKFSS